MDNSTDVAFSGGLSSSMVNTFQEESKQKSRTKNSALEIVLSCLY